MNTLIVSTIEPEPLTKLPTLVVQLNNDARQFSIARIQIIHACNVLRLSLPQNEMASITRSDIAMVRYKLLVLSTGPRMIRSWPRYRCRRQNHVATCGDQTQGPLC